MTLVLNWVSSSADCCHTSCRCMAAEAKAREKAAKAEERERECKALHVMHLDHTPKS